MPMKEGYRLTVPQVAQVLARLKDRGGSRYTDIRNALTQGNCQPSFFQLKAVLTKACKEGVIRQNAQGRWLLNLANFKNPRGAKEVASSSSLHRRRRGRKRGRGGRKKGKGKKGKGRRRRRRRRGRKGKGKGKGKKKGRGRRRRRRRRRRRGKGKGKGKR